MGYIISIMGVDGSGKSTLAKAVSAEMEARGEKVVVVWGALRPVLMRPFIKAAKFLLVRRHDKFADYEKHIEAKKSGMRRLSWTNVFSFWMVLIDYWPQVIYKIYIPRLMGYHVICDRYYHDLMIDYGITTNASLSRIQKLIGVARRMFMNPDIEYYDAVASSLGIQVLDGSASIDENRSRIMGDIDRLGATDG